jgi:hypothetical protein
LVEDCVQINIVRPGNGEIRVDTNRRDGLLLSGVALVLRRKSVDIVLSTTSVHDGKACLQLADYSWSEAGFSQKLTLEMPMVPGVDEEAYQACLSLFSTLGIDVFAILKPDELPGCGSKQNAAGIGACHQSIRNAVASFERLGFTGITITSAATKLFAAAKITTHVNLNVSEIAIEELELTLAELPELTRVVSVHISTNSDPNSDVRTNQYLTCVNDEYTTICARSSALCPAQLLWIEARYCTRSVDADLTR